MNVHIVTVMSNTDPELYLTKVFTDIDDARDYVVQVAQTEYGRKFDSFNEYLLWLTKFHMSITIDDSDIDYSLTESGTIVLLEDVELIVDEKQFDLT